MDGGSSIAVGDVVLDKYRVERVIGAGGMGLVVAARHVALDELFAIKLMLPSFAADREAQQRFLREARAAARLKGDHVAKVQDVGCLADGTSYMVMEYLAGEDLKKVIRKQGPLPVERAVEYTLQACKALREAHALGIVHRDIKSANLMLVPRPDGPPRVKLIDFGISKHTGAVDDLTANNWTGGSPLYMPPEQIRSAKRVDVRADVWSIGVVLYELLAGTTPFRATSIAAVMHRVLYEDPTPIGDLRELLPPALSSAVMRCLSKRPEDRFPSVDALMEALVAALPGAVSEAGEGIVVTPPARVSLPSTPYETVASGAPASVTTACAAPRLSNTDLGFGPVPSAVPPPPSGTVAPARRALRAAVVAALVAVCGSGGGAAWVRLRSDSEVPANERMGTTDVSWGAAPAAVPMAPREPAAAVPPAASDAGGPALVVSPAETVSLGNGSASASGIPRVAPKAAAGEMPSAASREAGKKREPARPGGTAFTAPARRKPEPLY